MKKPFIFYLLVSLSFQPFLALAQEEGYSESSTEDQTVQLPPSSSPSEASSSKEESQPSSQEDKKEEEKKREETKPQSKSVETKEEKENEAGLEEEKDDDDQVDFRVTTNYTTQEFIKKIGPTARKLGQEHDLYASIMIAQAILESGSGNSGLAQAPHYNLFGIKGDYKGSSVNMSTQEDDGTGKLYTIKDAFRSYPSYKESLEDYAELLTSPTYLGARKSRTGSYEEASKSLTGLYATDRHYDRKLNAIIEAYHLTKYDQDKKKSLLEEYPDGDFPDYDGKEYPGSEAYEEGSAHFSFNRISQLGGEIGQDWGQSKDWAQKAQEAGYMVNQEAKAGKILVLSPGQAKAAQTGQVAVVEKVYKSGAILISEYSKIRKNLLSFRVIDAQDAKQFSYIEARIVNQDED